MNNLLEFHAAERLVAALTGKNLKDSEYPAVKQLTISESQAQEIAIHYPIGVGMIRKMFNVVDDMEFYPSAK